MHKSIGKLKKIKAREAFKYYKMGIPVYANGKIKMNTSVVTGVKQEETGGRRAFDKEVKRINTLLDTKSLKYYIES